MVWTYEKNHTQLCHGTKLETGRPQRTRARFTSDEKYSNYSRRDWFYYPKLNAVVVNMHTRVAFVTYPLYTLGYAVAYASLGWGRGRPRAGGGPIGLVWFRSACYARVHACWLMVLLQ